MEATQGSLVIIGANTAECKVFWNGHELPDVAGLNVSVDEDEHRVVLKVHETPLFTEMVEAGIQVRRV